MSNPKDIHVLNIELFGTADGQEIEKFITLQGLRSGADVISDHQHLTEFKAGISYRLIIVASSSEHFARKSANEIAKVFDGLVC